MIVKKDFSIMASPTGEADFVKFVQTLPGVASGSDGSSGYYVRGGNMGSNLQTLDGVPIYGTSHLAGLASPYPSEIISSAEFLVGGFTSEEGNLGASHIRLHSLESPEEFSAKAEASNFLLGGYVFAPLKKDGMSVIASLRVSPMQFEYAAVKDLFDDEAVAIRNAKAAIGDAYVKLNWLMPSGSNLSASVFGSLDNYVFDLNSGSKDNMQWSNLIGIVKYDKALTKNRGLSVTGSYDHYSNGQGMFKQMNLTSNNLMILSAIDEFSLQSLIRQQLKGSAQAQYGIKGRLARFNPGSARVLESTGVFFKSSSPLSRNASLNSTFTAHGQLELGKMSKHFARAAARLNYNTAAGFNPEASGLLRFHLFKWLGIEGTADCLVQYYHTLEGTPLGWSLDMVVPPSKRLKPEITKQLYGGIFADFGKHHISGGWYKKAMDNLTYYSDATKLFDSSLAGWSENIEIGTGASYGYECLYEKTGGRIGWRIAYTWSKTDRTFPNLNKGETFPAKFDRRHILNASLNVLLVSKRKMNVSAAGLFTYQSGHWETVTAGSWWDDNFITGWVEHDFYTSLNNYEMPPYIRCDLSIAFEFKQGRHPQTLNVGVFNVLNRHNPFSLSYDPDTDSWKQISLLPVMPSLKYSIQF